MTTFLVTYRKRYWIEVITIEIEAYSFGEAETKFHNDFEPESDLIIIQIALK